MQEPFRLGQQLGHYTLVRLLGQGGFAEVYLGEHIHLNTFAAVKVLHTRLGNEDIQAFKQEAQMVARLLHPHIVRVLDFGVENALPYLVMDYAPNGTLRSKFPKGQRVPLPIVVDITKQVAAGLHYAHEQRIVHRDVKPENMLLNTQQQVLLSDFGIAVIQQSSRLLSTQNIAGTIAYMAPEQIQAHPLPSSDQYALAIVVYEWLCGTRPFHGSYTEIAVKQATVAPPPLRALAPDISPAVELVVMQALQKHPQQRFPSIYAFALALEQAALSQTHVSFSTQHMSSSAQSSYLATPATSILPPSQSLVANTPSSNMASLTPVTAPPALLPPYQPVMQSPMPYGYAPLQQWQPAFDPSLPQNRQKARGVSRRTVLLAGTLGALVVGGLGVTYTLGRIQAGQQLVQQTTQGNMQHLLSGTPAPQAALTYRQHTKLVWLVRWSPDGQYIASASFDGTMQVWTANTGATKLSVRSMLQPPISDDYPWSLSWSSRKDGKLAVSFVDGTIQVLDMTSSSRVASLDTRATAVPVLAWSPDERYLAVGGSDNIVRVYSYPGWQAVTSYQEHTDTINCLSWSPDGSTLASGSNDTTVRLWEPLTGKTLLIYSGHSDRVGHLAWSYDNTRIVSTSGDQSAKVWQVKAGITLYTYNAPTGAPIGEAQWSHNNQIIAVYSGSATIDFLDAQSGKVRQSYMTGVIYSLSWSPDDTRIVTGNYNNVAQIWHV